MSTNEIVELLDKNTAVLESYVLIREIKMYLDVKYNNFHPLLKIKIYKSSIISNSDFHFEVSHHVHTPEQAAPYHTSRTDCKSEQLAIKQAIMTTINFIHLAIEKGHEPSEEWMIPNEDF
jgi:hypothetical protein